MYLWLNFHKMLKTSHILASLLGYEYFTQRKYHVAAAKNWSKLVNVEYVCVKAVFCLFISPCSLFTDTVIMGRGSVLIFSSLALLPLTPLTEAPNAPSSPSSSSLFLLLPLFSLVCLFPSASSPSQKPPGQTVSSVTTPSCISPSPFTFALSPFVYISSVSFQLLLKWSIRLMIIHN